MTESFKSLTEKGVFKRNKLFSIQIENLHVQSGFNLRENDEDLKSHISDIADYIAKGGQLPPLLIRIAEDGRVMIVDGHCRHAGYTLAKERGYAVDWIDVLPFRGDDNDAVAMIMHSASGKPLTPLETAEGYKRLNDAGMSSTQIAERFGKTRQSVDGLLLVSNAHPKLKEMIRSGVVSAAIAATAIRQHGEDAYAWLMTQHEAATSQGKSKITQGTIAANDSGIIKDAAQTDLEDLTGKPGKTSVKSLRAGIATFLESVGKSHLSVDGNKTVSVSVDAIAALKRLLPPDMRMNDGPH